MREYLFQGYSEHSKKWVYGSLIRKDNYCCILHKDVHLIDEPYLDVDTGCIDGYATPVVPESVGQYAGMNEFVMSDRSYNKPLFEGDIVEVWSRRRQPTENMFIFRDKPTSKYDVEVRARAVICFKNGEWSLDYNNNYNKALCELRGNEQYERTVEAGKRLYDFGFHYGDEDWHREHNARYKWDDIVKIGTVFENSDLLEG